MVATILIAQNMNPPMTIRLKNTKQDIMMEVTTFTKTTTMMDLIMVKTPTLSITILLIKTHLTITMATITMP